METITSRQNPLLRHAKKLLTSRSYREACGEFAADGTKLLEEAAQLPGLQIKGLMCIPPICETETQVCKYFETMHQSFIDIKDKKHHNIDMDILSMGMSGDFEAAIAEGSTLVRVGSAIFGARQYR